VLDRDLAEVTSSSHLQRHLVDMIGSEVDDDAQKCLRELKTVKLLDSVSPDSFLRLQYTEPSDDAIRSIPHRIGAFTCDVIM